MEFLILLFRVVLSGVFLTAGIGKLLDKNGSEKALSEFGVPKQLVPFLSAVLPWIEIAVAVAIVFDPTFRIGTVAAAVLLAAFTGGMIVQMVKGNAPDCHCFGQLHSEPVSSRSVIRNAALLLLASALAIFGSAPRAGGFAGPNSALLQTNAMELLIGIAAVALLVAIFVVLKKISEQQGQIIRRIEILEVISGEGREVARDKVSDPHAGLPLGAPLPVFSVAGDSGISIPSSDLVADGKPSMLIFVSPTCHPCEALIPEINAWVEEFRDRMDILLVSTGEWDENVEKFGEANAERLFIQQGTEAAEILGPLWTPTAILIDSRGRIASGNAAGDTAIKELFAQVRRTSLDSEYLFVPNGSADEILIGTDVPEFRLKDLEGNEFTSEDLKGRRTLAAFWSTTCPFCVKMIEDLREWNGSKGKDAPDLVVFSSGEEEPHKSLDLLAPILLEDDYETAGKLGMNGTPSAVLIDENGKIISETAVGAEKIWSLLGETGRLSRSKNG